MSKVSIPRSQIADGSLPSVCIVCGTDAPHRQYSSLSSISHFFSAPIIGLLPFWGTIMMAGRKSAGKVGGLPFCDVHSNYWSRRARFIVVFGVCFIGLVVAFGITNPPPKPGQPRQFVNRPDVGGRQALAAKKVSPWLAALGGVAIFIGFPTAAIIHLVAMRPVGGDSDSITFSGVSREFADAVGQFE